MGGKNWRPIAYNPTLNLYYIPVIESCNIIITEEAKAGTWKAREFWIGGGLRQHEPIYGSVTAVDVTNAPPITYSVNDKQYIAILVGLGGAWPK